MDWRSTVVSHFTMDGKVAELVVDDGLGDMALDHQLRERKRKKFLEKMKMIKGE